MRLFLVLVLLLTTRTANAEKQIWTALFAQARPGATGITGWFDLHARRRAPDLVTLVRPGIGYTFNNELVAHVGYGWIETITDEGANAREHRAWQQAIYTHTLDGPNKLQARLRLEQRFRPTDDDIGHRVRIFTRGQFAPADAVNMQLVGWNELFVGLNDTEGGLASGFDQNRLFVGLGSDTVLKGVRIELGYLNVATRKGENTQIDHAVAANLFVTLAP